MFKRNAQTSVTFAIPSVLIDSRLLHILSSIVRLLNRFFILKPSTIYNTDSTFTDGNSLKMGSSKKNLQPILLFGKIVKTAAC